MNSTIIMTDICSWNTLQTFVLGSLVIQTKYTALTQKIASCTISSVLHCSDNYYWLLPKTKQLLFQTKHPALNSLGQKNILLHFYETVISCAALETWKPSPLSHSKHLGLADDWVTLFACYWWRQSFWSCFHKIKHIYQSASSLVGINLKASLNTEP